MEVVLEWVASENHGKKHKTKQIKKKKKEDLSSQESGQSFGHNGYCTVVTSLSSLGSSVTLSS